MEELLVSCRIRDGGLRRREQRLRSKPLPLSASKKKTAVDLGGERAGLFGVAWSQSRVARVLEIPEAMPRLVVEYLPAALSFLRFDIIPRHTLEWRVVEMIFGLRCRVVERVLLSCLSTGFRTRKPEHLFLHTYTY